MPRQARIDASDETFLKTFCAKVETVLEIIKSTFESREDLLISGFGKLQVKEKAERRGRNPATGEFMMLDSRKIVTFQCSGKLRNKISAAR